MVHHLPHQLIVAGTYGATAVGLIAQTGPVGTAGGDYIDYGLTAMIASSFFYLVWAMVNRKLVARESVTDEDAAKVSLLKEQERTDLYAQLVAESLKREVQMDLHMDRLINLLQTKNDGGG